MGFCLNKTEQEKVKAALRDGSLNPEKLADMTSEERHTYFTDLVGKDNAAPTNALFESKLLLKHQQQGYVTWAKKLIGVSPQVKRDIISKIEKLDRVLDPASEKAFLKDLAEHKLGTNVSFDEAKAITDLTNAVKTTREKATDSETDRLKYGDALVNLKKYVDNLKLNSNKLSWADVKRNPGKFGMKLGEEVAGNAKAIQASLDNSAIFRQGWKTLWTHPGIWAKNAAKSFQHLATLRNQDTVMDKINADIMSRPTYDKMQKAGLDVGVNEEAYPTTLPEKIPVLGRIYKATENAYTAFVRKTRADVFDKYLNIAEKAGIDTDNINELKPIAQMVNSLTGRGNLGRLEGAGKAINNIFFSPKMLKAQIDAFTQPITGAGGSNFVRKQATINLVKTVAAQALILGIARALKPDSVELDPRSADFGKIKIGNTRFDATGGSSGLVVLASRLLSGQSKSSTSGKMTDIYNPKFGQSNGMDLIENFFENKLSPAAGLVRDFAKGETFDGKKPTLVGESINLFTPLPVKTFTELLNDPEAKKDPRFIAFAQVMDMLGINANTYTPRPKGAKQPDVDLGKIMNDADNYLNGRTPSPDAEPTPTKPAKKKLADFESMSPRNAEPVELGATAKRFIAKQRPSENIIDMRTDGSSEKGELISTVINADNDDDRNDAIRQLAAMPLTPPERYLVSQYQKNPMVETIKKIARSPVFLRYKKK